MKFIAYEQKAPLLLLLIVLLTSFGMSLWLLLLIPVLLLNYELTVQENEIRFTLRLFALRLWTRIATPETISQMEFKRAGWAVRSVAVHVTKGLNWRLLHFRPRNFDEALEEFADRHHISVTKYPDYPLR